MPRSNNQALNYLKSKGWTGSNSETVIRDLIDGGFIEADPITEPEQYAEAAKEWLGNVEGPGAVFEFASGWTTSSWEHVLGITIEHNLERQKAIFGALVILAKEAKVDL